MAKKRAIIIGAGPAGLTAAFELLTKTTDIEVVVLEETDSLGGLSKTVNYKGNRMDIGGHRFFSKSKEINDWWEKMMPLQPTVDTNYDHQAISADDVMLLRQRHSRILFNSKLYDYPISINWGTLSNFGFATTIKVAFSYIYSVLLEKKESNLEQFYIRRFGKRLYSMFFEHYTEKVWGRHPRHIDASWGAQRIKGLSIVNLLKDFFLFHKKDNGRETSLIRQFKYPKYGPGQLWGKTADKIVEMGGSIILNAKVIGLLQSNNKINNITYLKNGLETHIEGDYILSSMALKDLVNGLNDVPSELIKIAEGLPYRDFMALGVLVKKKSLQNSNIDITSDCWIYINDRNVKMGRMQIFNNWSPYLVRDEKNTIWLGLEYFVNEGDIYWNMTDKEFGHFATQEMIKLNFVQSSDDILDFHLERIKKAYPAYFDTYIYIDKLTEYLNSIDNLYCIGRNGQHRYNNMDHSMMTAMEASNSIINNTDKRKIWDINTEQEYHEQHN